MSVIFRRKCDICGEEFDENDNRQWVRIEHFIIHKYVTKQGVTINEYDLTIDCCPFCSAKLQRLVLNKEKKQ